MVDIASLQLEGSILSSDSPDYDTAIQRTSHLAIRRPKYVAFPSTFDDVSRLIGFARSNKLELAVKGGGANQTSAAISSSEGGLVIDLSKLNQVQVSEDRQTATVQGGAVWGNVYEELVKYDLDAVGGNIWFVGVGGFLTGGGHSNLSGIKGMGCDNIVSATIALADGSIVKADPEVNSDLFWAIRGGMGQFGIVLEFVLRVYPSTGPTNCGALIIPGSAFEQALPAIQDTLQKLEPQDKIIVNFIVTPPDFHPSIAILPSIPGSPERAESILSSLKPLSVFSHIQAAPSQLILSHVADESLARAPKRTFVVGSTLPDIGPGRGIDAQIFTDIWQRWTQWTADNKLGQESTIMWEFQPVGIVKDMDASQTAFGKRDSLSYVVIQGRTRSPEFDKQIEEWAREIAGLLRATRPDGGVTANFAFNDETVEELFGPESAKRLREIKSKYDPEHVWTKGYKF